MILRRILILSALALGLVAIQPAPVRAADPYQGAKDFIANLSKQAITTMTAKGQSEAEQVQRFRTLFIGSVDMPVIGKFVLGRHWRTATPEQQQEFLKLFEDMLVLTWSARFHDAADNVVFQVVDARPDVDQGVVVESHLLRDRQDPVTVLWRLRGTDGSFRIIDLIVESTSMLFEYREEYASVINQNGGKIEGLLDALRKKVAQLSQPAAK